MSKVREVHWPRIFAEGAAIVASILLAFWIDAWWDDREQRDREIVVLETLLDDLREKKALLERRVRRNEVKLESATTLLRAATDEDFELDKTEIDGLIGNIWWFENKILWDSAPMSSLIMGGTNILISNVDLLKKLAYLQVSISRVRNDAENAQAFVMDDLMPFLRQNANLAQIAMAVGHEPGMPTASYNFPVVKISVPRDHSPLLATLEFQGLLTDRIEHQLNFLRTLQTRNLDAQLDEVIGLLEQEIGK